MIEIYAWLLIAIGLGFLLRSTPLLALLVVLQWSLLAALLSNLPIHLKRILYSF